MSLNLRIRRKISRGFMNLSRSLYSRDDQEFTFLVSQLCDVGIPNALAFDEKLFRSSILGYVEKMRIPETPWSYRFSGSCSRPNLYSSTYACMTRSLLSDLNTLSDSDRAAWLSYFDSFQSPDDGLFYDPSVENEIFFSEDWWGIRHLAAQLIICYTHLGRRPRYEFSFLKVFYDRAKLRAWFDSLDFGDRVDFSGNSIMNIGVLMQYQRDAFSDHKASEAVEHLKALLRERVNSQGMWGKIATCPRSLSKAVQAAYHIWPIFFYDGDDIPKHPELIDHLLATQNLLGGYGLDFNSSACDDIDTIWPLIAFSSRYPNQSELIRRSVYKALPWILSNQNADGGFVFKRNCDYEYGHPQMSFRNNESSMFGTWFRLLSLTYIFNFLARPSDLRLGRAPGYEFSLVRSLVA